MLSDNKNKIITRLTASWALSESGLGGVMHAFKLPFTGFFLGGFAVVIIILIARFSNNPFKHIIQSTLLVVLVKATVTPHSPPMAYIAVGFQGLAGACIFQIGKSRWSAMLFGAVALLESAIQKFLVMTLIYGKSIWEALDIFYTGISKDLNFLPALSFSFFLILSYTSLYGVWGLVLGWWAHPLPQSLLNNQSQIMAEYQLLNQQTLHTASNPHRKKNKYKKLLTFIGVLLFIGTVFMFSGNQHKALAAILRTVAVLGVLYFVVTPAIKYGIKKWTNRKKDENSEELASIIQLLPELKNNLVPAMQLAKKNNRGLLVYKAFVVNFITLSLYNTHNE